MEPGPSFNYTSDRMFVMHLFGYEAKQPNLKLKTRPKQLLGYLPLVFALPDKPICCHFAQGALTCGVMATVVVAFTCKRCQCEDGFIRTLNKETALNLFFVAKRQIIMNLRNWSR